MTPAEATHALRLHTQNRRAALEMVAGAFAFATMACIAHGYRGQMAWPFVAFARIAVTVVFAHLMLRITGTPFLVRGTRALWWWLLPMGIAGTLGQVLMTSAYGHGTVTMVALVGIIQIAFSAFYDLTVWGHSFDFWKILGIAVIALAIAMNVLATAEAARKEALPGQETERARAEGGPDG